MGPGPTPTRLLSMARPSAPGCASGSCCWPTSAATGRAPGGSCTSSRCSTCPWSAVRRRLPESRRFATRHIDARSPATGTLLAAGGVGVPARPVRDAGEPARQRLPEGGARLLGAGIAVFTMVTATPAAIGIVIGGRLADTRGRRKVGVRRHRRRHDPVGRRLLVGRLPPVAVGLAAEHRRRRRGAGPGRLPARAVPRPRCGARPPAPSRSSAWPAPSPGSSWRAGWSTAGPPTGPPSPPSPSPPDRRRAGRDRLPGNGPAVLEQLNPEDRRPEVDGMAVPGAPAGLETLSQSRTTSAIWRSRPFHSWPAPSTHT